MKKLLLILLFLLLTVTAHAATYYMAPTPTGSDSNSGTSGSRWATFSHAFSEMSGGDTLIVGDGTYNQQIKNVPDGSSGAYTIVKAENDNEVTVISPQVDYQAALYLSYSEYIQVEGIKFDGNNYAEGAALVNNCNHIKILRCGFWGGVEVGDGHCFALTGGSNYCLVENCWANGGGRYKFHSAMTTHHNIFRRCVARHDYNDDEQTSEFTRYDATHVDYQNCISIDGYGTYGGFWNEKNDCGSNTTGKNLGCIVLNAGWATMRDLKEGGPNGAMGTRTITNCSFVGGGIGVNVGNQDGCGYITKTTANVTHCTIIGIDGGGPSQYGQGVGFHAEEYSTGGGEVNIEFKDSIIMDCDEYAVDSDWGYPASPFAVSHLIVYNNTNNFDSTVTASNIDYRNPNLLYLTRVEAGSPGDGNASDGGDRGATILYAYGDNGTLWGDPNYETINTSVPLWPWANEAEIQSDFRAHASGDTDGYRGFCANGQTLTKYIWQYLGNTIPADIYNGTEPGESIVITTSSMVGGTINTAYNQSISADKVANWSIISGSIPTNTTLVNTGNKTICYISGVPNTTGTFSFTVRANSTANNTINDTQNLSITIADVFNFPTTAVLDNFTRGDQTPLGSGWVVETDASGLSVISNECGSLNTSFQANEAWDTSYGPDSEVYAKVSNVNATSSAILALRYSQSTWNGYIISASPAGSGSVTLKRLDGGAGTILATYSQAVSDGDSIGMRMVGSNLTAAYKSGAGAWTSLGSVTDTTYSTAGKLAISMDVSDIRIDDFGGGTYQSGTGNISITTTSLANGTNSSYYNQSINATAAGNWTLASGAYPTNLSIAGNNSATVYLQGYPNLTGTYSFVVRVANATVNDTQSYSVTIGSSDTIPPANITTLAATTGSYAGAIVLTWTSVGDDGNTGTVTTNEIKYSTSNIGDNTTYSNALSVGGMPTPQVAGTVQTVTVSGLVNATKYYFAMKSWDNEQQVSGLSNTANATSGNTPAAPAAGPYGFKLR